MNNQMAATTPAARGNAAALMTEADRHAQLLADWQEKVKREGEAEIRTDVISAYGRYDERHEDFYAEVMGKSKTEIYRANFRAENLNYEEILNQFSADNCQPRPVRLGDDFNGFWATCAIAFFINYCRRFCLDASDLYVQAYAGENGTLSEAEQDQILEDALWEGIQFPENWNPANLALLKKAITNINYHQLVSQIDALEEIGIFENSADEPPSLAVSALAQPPTSKLLAA